MLPDVEAYNTAITKANEEYRAQRDALTAKHRETGTQYDSAYYDEVDALVKAREDAKEGAWEALKSSEDTFIKWVAENCSNYRDEAVVVLEHAPYADADQLENLRAEHGWCGAWASLHEQAEAAGVIPGTVPLSPEREALVVELTRVHGISRHRAKNLLKLMDAVYLADTKPTE